MNSLLLQRLLFLALVVATTAFTYSELLTSDRVPLFRDVVVFFVPLKIHLAEALASWRVPLWNPWISLGHPFLAELQTNALYPPSLILLLGFPLGLNLFLFAHYAIAIAGMFLLLWDRGIEPGATAVGILTYVLGGFLVSMLNVMSLLESAAWAPWVLFLGRRLTTGSSGRGTFVGLVVVVTLQTLAGGAEILLLTLAATSVYALVAHPIDRGRVVRGAMLLGGAFVLAGAAAAFQVLPTAELVEQSTRARSLRFEGVAGWSLQPVSLLQIFLPQSSSLVSPEHHGGMGFGFEKGSTFLNTLYFGLLPVFFAAAGSAFGKDRRLWTAIGLVGLLLAFGTYTPVFGWTFTVAPWIIGKFRYPEKCFFLTHLAVSILAAEGARLTFLGERRARRVVAIAAITTLIMFLAVGVARWSRPVDFVNGMRILGANPEMSLAMAVTLASDVFFKSMRGAVVVVAALFGLSLGRSRLVRSSIASFFLVGLVAADLASTHKDFNLAVDSSRLEAGNEPIDLAPVRAGHWRVFSYSLYQPPEGGYARLRDTPSEFPRSKEMADWMVTAWNRLMVNASMPRHVGAPFGGVSIARSDNLILRDRLRILPVDKGIDLLAAFSVRYLFGLEALESKRLREIASARPDGIRAYEIERPAPRAYLAGKLRVASSSEATINHLIDPGFQRDGEAVVEVLPAGWQDALPGELIGTAEIRRYGPEQVVVRIRAERPALLVLNDSYYPGWVAWVDGRRSEIIRANQFVRGVRVGPGAREVTFSYEPRSFRLGMWISLLAWGVLAGILVGGWRRRGGAAA